MSIFGKDDETATITELTADNMTIGTDNSHLVKLQANDGGNYYVSQKEA